jgi:hypothetical protein
MKDSINLFEQYGWDWTYLSLDAANIFNPTFTPDDVITGEPYGDVMTPAFKALLAGFALNGTNHQAAHIPLPHEVSGTYFTDFSGNEVANWPASHKEVPAGWTQPQGTVALGSNVSDAVLIHTLSGTNPTQTLTYSRATYDIDDKTLMAGATLSAGTSAGLSSHLVLATSSSKVDVWENSDRTIGWNVTDGSYQSSGTRHLRSDTLKVVITIDKHGVTIVPDTALPVRVSHSFATLTGYQLLLTGASNGGANTPAGTTVTADDVFVTHDFSDLAKILLYTRIG